MRRILVAAVVIAASSAAMAGEPEVVAATATRADDGRYRFEVTVRHADQGWDHYADRWEVLTPAGEHLGTRVLHHPHEHEQPFTRSLGGVVIPAGLESVRVRAHDSVHGWGSQERSVELR